jgi:hypothetical protein
VRYGVLEIKEHRTAHINDILNTIPALPGWTMLADELFPYHTTEQG